MLDVALLGTGGMMPLPNRFLASFICRLNGRYLLIDCGEGTQVTLKMLGWGFKNIDIICLTHYHADHVSGLPGILLTIGNSGRTEPLNIIGPKGLEDVIKGLTVIAPELPFEINIIEINEDGKNEIIINDYVIKTLKVEHAITCIAYSIEVKRSGKFDVEKAKLLNIPQKFWSLLQKNTDVEFEGKIYTSDMVMGKKRKGIKVCYCTDTRPTEEIPAFIDGADLFICEGMYGDDEKIERVSEHKHMVFSEAANLAKKGNVKQLWLTHFSPALLEPAEFTESVQKIFKDTKIGYDRLTDTIIFQND